jgi:2,3,4,5-tetrahydropyridine-2-carboxylate N-succinyltransferase
MTSVKTESAETIQLKEKIESIFSEQSPPPNALDTVKEVIAKLDDGSITVVDQVSDGQWTVNSWVKKAILLYFRLMPVEKMDVGPFVDKVPIKIFSASTNRIVPYSSARHGSYVAAKVVIMAPSFINIGAYVDESSMVDSLVLVGSCARVGKNVHLGAGTIIGGVLEPPNSHPVIIEDNAFVGGNCGIYEGCLIEKNAVIAAGTIITAGTPIIDINSGQEYYGHVPANAVVIPGGRVRKTSKAGHELIFQTPLIVKYKDEGISAKLALEESLRSFS